MTIAVDMGRKATKAKKQSLQSTHLGAYGLKRVKGKGTTLKRYMLPITLPSPYNGYPFGFLE